MHAARYRHGQTGCCLPAANAADADAETAAPPSISGPFDTCAPEVGDRLLKNDNNRTYGSTERAEMALGLIAAHPNDALGGPARQRSARRVSATCGDHRHHLMIQLQAPNRPTR